ncbi:MAG: class I SAM-dependent methyltransferase [Gammaproteobacteria bacterium]|nr:class I SAM-dependent methyltransferase [Gammaproteobacteria bacterium]
MNDPSLTVVNYDEKRAKSYNEKRFNTSRRMRQLDRVEKAFAASLMQLVGCNGSILDIPCGAARFVSIFSQAKRLFCADVSYEMLGVSHKNVVCLDKGLFIQSDIRKIPLPDHCVDLSFCMRLLHHIALPDLRKSILYELQRVSKRWVAVSFYRKECFRYFRKRLLGKKVSGYPIWTRTFKQEAHSCGLKVVRSIPSYLNGSSQTLVLLEKV